jgi:hypothetical protein
MGNIYVSDEEPTEIVSLIDWQSVVVSPLFYQVRFPEFISIGEDYELGCEIPTPPENIDEMDEADQAITRFKHKQTMMGKTCEAASGFKNKNVFKSLRLPPLYRQLFLRTGEAWEEGTVPLRACLIALADVWHEAGFSGACPCNFSTDEIEKHQQDSKNTETTTRSTSSPASIWIPIPTAGSPPTMTLRRSSSGTRNSLTFA